MSDVATIIGFVAVALLGSYLYYRHQERNYKIPEQRDTPQRAGHPIDAAELKHRLQKVRGDYLAARGMPRGVCFHRSLLGFTRRTIAHLTYFRDKHRNEHAQSPERL